jgi:two-component system chemotaxis sensor kinase CheA
VGDGHYVIPLDRVVECVEHLRRQDNYEGYIKLRDKLLPLLRLHQLFGVQSKLKDTHESIVVVEHGGYQVGLVVDKFLGEFQAVIKPLSKIFEKLVGISGATILGTGEVALILDIPTLVQHYVILSQRGVRWIG